MLGWESSYSVSLARFSCLFYILCSSSDRSHCVCKRISPGWRGSPGGPGGPDRPARAGRGGVGRGPNRTEPYVLYGRAMPVRAIFRGALGALDLDRTVPYAATGWLSIRLRSPSRPISLAFPGLLAVCLSSSSLSVSMTTTSHNGML